MRIAHITPYFQPHLGYQEYYLAKHQISLGHEVAVMTSNKEYPHLVSHLSQNRVLYTGYHSEMGVRTIRLLAFFETEYAPNLTVVKGLKNEIKKFDPDIVHAHSMFDFMTLMVCSWKKNFRYRLLVDLHVLPLLSGFLRPAKLLYQKLYEKLIFPYIINPNVDLFIAVTPAVYSWLKEKLAIPSPKLIFIPLGADTERFKESVQMRREVRNSIGLGTDDILLIYAGKIQPDKGIETLIKAMGVIAPKRVGVKLLLVGKGDQLYIDKLRRLAYNNRISTDFVLAGYVPHNELFKYYCAGDIGIWPGSPSITIIEAMACGLPIIIAESNYTSHLLAGQNGFCFKPSDYIGLSHQLRKLIANDLERKKMARRSSKLVSDRFSWKVIAQETVEAYRRLM